ncbi:winged helix-turn-helix transcriptional regulator [Agromyces intestinalis]|uniref:Winged helix-turn-helix transcriptional regulator n=1 Tax=Agromyces intestinalis TaxID=2592652 RepID=A0A5C1YJC3_9MICO|nr:MarR family winged helix-turn-helix transcriptional regulator [Agromyces intestinalis]QEO14902.1 winged helix-turn-helix transcriptional regulator [Agromyces intestinalis]
MQHNDQGERAEDPRSTDASGILHALMLISRRGVADARTAPTSLSMTAQSIVAFIVDHPGTRSVDLAREFRLNRSTVSRQLGDLVALGLVREASGTGRGRPLELTEAGRRAYDETVAILQAVVDASLAGWSDAEVARFARDLARFNAATTGSAGGRVEPVGSSPDPDASGEEPPRGIRP